MPVEMVVESIRMNLLAPTRVVFLKEIKGERYLPIIIGVPEADAIAIKLQSAEVPRPLTHDLLSSMIQTLGGRVTHIIVTDLVDETFFARIVMDVDGRHVEVDSRPSDAIALAVRVNVPIYVEEAVLEKGAIEPDEGRGSAEEPAGERIKEEQLAAFRDVINQLNLDDLGGPKR
ncbi:MAG: bifunctional nuclease family protein [Chloroflexota bacterium]